MVERRYNQEQKSRVVLSGEQPPVDDSMLPDWITRLGKNLAVSVPRSITDTTMMLGMVPGMVRAGLSSDVDLGEGIYGQEAIANAQAYTTSETQRLLSELPEARRTPRNIAAIEEAVRGSQPIHDILTEGANPVVRGSVAAGNWINDAVGLQPTNQETIVDDLEQIAGAVLVPTGGISKLVQTGAKAGIRSGIDKTLKVATDVLVPGTSTYTKAGIGINATGQTAASQGFRAFGDQPSVLTGDALAADQGVDPSYVPDPDPEGGMGAEKMLAGGLGLLGSMSLAAAVMAGKANKAVAKEAVDPVDKVGVITDVDREQFAPVLTKLQRVKSNLLDSSAPLRDVAAHAADESGFTRSIQLETKINELERVVHDTAQVSINTATKNALDMGILPGMKERTVPLTQVRKLHDSLLPEEQQLFKDASFAGTYLDRHQLKLQSAEDQMLAAKLGIDNPGGKKAYAAKKAEFDQLKADTAELPNAMTVKQARDITAAAQAHPKIAQMQMMYQKVTRDILNAKVMDGQISQKMADALAKEHPSFVHLQEKYETNWWKRLKEDFQGTSPRGSLFPQNRAPIRGGRKVGDEVGKAVDDPIHPLDALSEYIADHVAYTRRNEATRTFVNAIKDTKDFGRSIKHHDSMTLEDFRHAKSSENIEKRQDIFAFTEGGKIHMYTAADPEVMRALKFNAPATATLFNMMRKQAQQGITGVFRPIFAATSMKYEHEIIRGTAARGRTYGPLQVMMNRVAPNSKVIQSIIDSTGDPLAMLSVYAGLAKTLSVSAMHKAATKMADGLVDNSGMAAWIAKAPGGRQMLEKATEAMLRSYNDSTFALFVEHGIKRSNPNADMVSELKPRYDAASALFNSQSRTGKAWKQTKELFHDYMSVLDQIQNAPKYAYFAQNLAALERKYGGRVAVPEREINKLVHDVKSSSGDMTRAPGSPFVSQVASAFPYGHIMINSTYHLASAIKHDPLRIGSKVISSTVLPKVIGISMISAYGMRGENGENELANWYWNNIPSWERIGKTPVIGPEWFIDMAQGNVRPLTENDIYLTPDAPEFVAINNSVVAFLRSFGLLGDQATENASFSKDFGEGLEALTGLATPPLAGLIAGGAKFDLGRAITGPLTGKTVMQAPYEQSPHQGSNPEGINQDSIFSHSFANMLTAVFGTAANQVIQSTDVGIQSMQNGDSFMEAFGRAMAYESYANERSLPETPGTRGLGAFLYTNGQRRRYASTQQRERILQVMDKFDPIVKQLSMDKDKRNVAEKADEMGMQAAPTIQDPVVAQMAKDMYQVLKSGPMFVLGNKRTEQNKLLARLEMSKDTMSPAVYHLKANAIREAQDEINEQQEDILNTLDVTIHHKYGLNVDSAIEAIHGSIGRDQQ